MSEGSAAAVSGAVIAEDPAASGGAGGGLEQPSPPDPGPLRCGSCALWPRQQTWLCVVPLLIGFIGLGLSLMLLKWIVVGSVKDYVPTDLVDNKGIGQDPIFLSKPSAFPKNVETTTTTTTAMGRTRTGLVTTTTAANPGVMVPAGSGSSTSRAPNRISTRITTTTRAPRLIPPGGRGVTPRGTTVRRVTTGSSGVGMGTVTMVPSMVVSVTTEAHLDATSPPSPSGRFYLHDSTSVWTVSQFPAESSPLVPTQLHTHTKTHRSRLVVASRPSEDSNSQEPLHVPAEHVPGGDVLIGSRPEGKLNAEAKMQPAVITNCLDLQGLEKYLEPLHRFLQGVEELKERVEELGATAAAPVKALKDFVQRRRKLRR
ncbi:NRG3 protein, partial [Polypterus senegalus]